MLKDQNFGGVGDGPTQPHALMAASISFLQGAGRRFIWFIGTDSETSKTSPLLAGLRINFIVALLLFGSWTHGLTPLTTSQTVLTHLYNAQRTGWNASETVLNTTNVASAKFGVLATNTTLDARIDTQPLIVRGLKVGGTPRDVVYLGTENDTLYMLDANTAAVITSVSLGTAVPNSVACNNDNTTVGILSTPVIDLTARTIFVMAYAMIGSTPTYQLHALDLASLTDKVVPATVSASYKLSDGATVYNFNATVSRQKSALLLANGNIYAGFASFCDFNQTITRGWVLAWQESEGALTPLGAKELTDSWVTNPFGSYYLGSIWMSGAGLAADASGNIFGVTGNGGSSGTSTSFSPPTSIQNTVFKFSADLSTLQDYFSDPNMAASDNGDSDFASGGVMLLPDQPGTVTHLALAAGKPGIFYLMNRDSMGHWTNGGPANVVATWTGHHCFCGPSYFVGSDGLSRVAMPTTTSAIGIVQINATNSTFGTEVDTAVTSNSVPFTTVSSNGTTAGTHIIWAIGRPGNPGTIGNFPPHLYAFDAMSGATLFTGVCGQWTNGNSNMNTVPVVSGGKVYIATDQYLYIFGLSP